jgi:hypothetical protein
MMDAKARDHKKAHHRNETAFGEDRHCSVCRAEIAGVIKEYPRCEKEAQA